MEHLGTDLESPIETGKKFSRIPPELKIGYTDTTAKAGKTYYYKVKADHSNAEANTAYSSVKCIKAK